MIEMFTGTPGSGKSLNCARRIIEKLQRRKGVIANYDINLTVFGKKKIGSFTYVDNSDLTPELLYTYAHENHKRNSNGNMIERQTLLIIDECQIIFNSRDWNMKNRAEWCRFFTQHRKYGFDIILVCQNDRMIDRQIRSLVEYQVIHRNVKNFKLLGLIIGLICGGHLFVAITQWYGIKEKTDSQFFRMKKQYIRLYDSYRIFRTAESGGSGAPTKQAVAPITPIETIVPEQTIYPEKEKEFADSTNGRRQTDHETPCVCSGENGNTAENSKQSKKYPWDRILKNFFPAAN